MMRCRHGGTLLLLAIVVVVGGAGYGALWPLQLAADWKVIDTIALPRPDSLAVDAAGRLHYVSLETGPGRLVELTAAGPRTVFGEFGEPDGLLAGAASLIVTEEKNRPDGSWPTTLQPPHCAYWHAWTVPRACCDGRTAAWWCLRTGRTGNCGCCATTLRRSCWQTAWTSRRECACCRTVASASPSRAADESWPGGSAGIQILAENLDGIDQLACGADGSLWGVISQNRSGKLIRMENGRRRVIARHLRQPQGIALAPDGTVYLAETRADRVLHLAPPR